MPSAFSLVLQMPRGNLETIYPRALVLAGIRKSIDERDYRAAFMACRSHRVDMNIIPDHNPGKFIPNVGEFVKTVKKVEHIDLFLSQLRNEDVTTTMYRDTIKKADAANSTEQTAPFDITNKVNSICDAFLAVFDKSPDSHLQNIITAHVSKTPPDLEGGLHIISKLKSAGDDAQADVAAEHICFLADVNTLYDNALGIYDLDVTLLIAQQSQKDPREYLPYLQNLQSMSKLRRHFQIDNDLKRYSKALKHLHDLDEFEELERYVEKHELYGEAMEMYKYQEERLRSLMRLHAEYLVTMNRFKEAGIAYEFLEDYQAAYPAYRSASLWREALSSAQLSSMSSEGVKDLAKDLADSLEEAKEYHAAATIYLEYLADVKNGVRFLCKASLFADAIRTVALAGKTDLLKETVDTGLIDGFNTTTELLADCKAQLAAQVPRLRELRIKKEREPLAFFTGDAAGTERDYPDDVSLAATDASTTGGSFMTRYTERSAGTGTLNTAASRRSSKNRRREERKRARGKKGSVYEEEYLVNSIKRLVERINVVNEDVGRLVDGLMRRGMRERARTVQQGMVEMIALCDEVVKGDVFEQQEKNEQQTEGLETQQATNGDYGIDYLNGVQQEKVVPPVVKKFERLMLLG
jgi:elongator complex protein 1